MEGNFTAALERTVHGRQQRLSERSVVCQRQQTRTVPEDAVRYPRSALNNVLAVGFEQIILSGKKEGSVQSAD